MATRIGVTPGEPAGIGPDVCIRSFAEAANLAEVIYYASPELISERADRLGINVTINCLDQEPFIPSAMNIQPVPLSTSVSPGKCDPANAAYVMQTLSLALSDCAAGNTRAMVTGPVNKASIIEAGYRFSGHTEWLAEETGTPRVVMMLAAGDLRVTLATTHLPLASVSTAITQDMLRETIIIIHKALRTDFGIAEPRISVCGLNPHAGEGGHLGREELDVISPVINELGAAGMKVTGPVPADTAFTPAMLASCDTVLAMYHDQGLPVIKHAAFEHAVNITLGLPIIRTSVDHGTALDLAGTGKADHRNMLAALRSAITLAGNR